MKSLERWGGGFNGWGESFPTTESIDLSLSYLITPALNQGEFGIYVVFVCVYNLIHACNYLLSKNVLNKADRVAKGVK